MVADLLFCLAIFSIIAFHGYERSVYLPRRRARMKEIARQRQSILDDCKTPDAKAAMEIRLTNLERKAYNEIHRRT